MIVRISGEGQFELSDDHHHRLNELDDAAVLHQVSDEVPFVDLSSDYKLVGDFERLVEHVPSLVAAESLTVEGAWIFGPDVRVVGKAELTADGAPGRVEHTLLGQD